MTVVWAAVAGRLMSKPMAPTAAAASVAAILRDMSNLLLFVSMAMRSIGESDRRGDAAGLSLRA